MNAVLRKSLDAIESSLATLLESVAADDPSAEAAAALVAADDDLSSSLEQLVTHQTNHQRLLHLRALSSALDAELSLLLTNLSAARQELLAAPSTVFPAHSRPVEYDTLLSYATKISKFTRPPTHFSQQQQTKKQQDERRDEGVKEEGDTVMTGSGTAAPAGGKGTASTALVKAEANGATAAPSNTNDKNSTPAGDKKNSKPGDNAAESGGVGAGSSGNAATRPTAEDIAMLDPSANMPFAPWPSEEVMKRGILANMGHLEAVPVNTDQKGAEGAGENAAGANAAAAGGHEGGAAAGGRQMSEADRERAREESAKREAERKAKEQSVFEGLDLYDPDSD